MFLLALGGALVKTGSVSSDDVLVGIGELSFDFNILSFDFWHVLTCKVLISVVGVWLCRPQLSWSVFKAQLLLWHLSQANDMSIQPIPSFLPKL